MGIRTIPGLALTTGIPVSRDVLVKLLKVIGLISG
jgi:hypothetical protein